MRPDGGSGSRRLSSNRWLKLIGGGVVRDGLYNSLGGVLRVGFTVLSIAVLIKLLGLSEYGLYALMSATMGLMAFAEGGLGGSTTVFLSRDLADDAGTGVAETLTLTGGAMLVLATLAAVALVVAAPIIVDSFATLSSEQRPGAIQALQAGGIVVWGRLLQSIPAGVEQAYRRYGILNALNTAQAALMSLGAIGVAWLGGKTPELVRWQAITALILLAAHIWFASRLLGRAHLRLAWPRRRGRAIAHYSLLTWLSVLGSILFSQADRIIVGAVLGTGAVGVYAAITSATMQINNFSALPVQPLVPLLSRWREGAESVRHNIRREVRRAATLNIAIVAGLGALFFFGAPAIIRVIAPVPDASDYVPLFQIATVIYSIYSLNAVGYMVLLVEAPLMNVIITLGSGILALAFIYILSITIGLRGAIIGNAGYCATLLLVYFGIRRTSTPERLESHLVPDPAPGTAGRSSA